MSLDTIDFLGHPFVDTRISLWRVPRVLHGVGFVCQGKVEFLQYLAYMVACDHRGERAFAVGLSISYAAP